LVCCADGDDILRPWWWTTGLAAGLLVCGMSSAHMDFPIPACLFLAALCISIN
jgi:hypothetical protein